MKIHKLDINRMIALNGLKEVSDLSLLNKGVPTPNGLFSYEVFGFSQQERKSIPAYIDLKGSYLHPLTYYNLKMINRKFESLILGTKYYKVSDKGELIEDPNGETGIDFLYRVWDAINFKDTKSIFGTEKIKNIKEKKTSWMSKTIVLPAFFRDINFNDEKRPSYDEINEKYVNLIRMVHSVSQQEQYGLVSNQTKARIQLILNEIHDTLIETHLRLKHGTFKKNVMGKNIDYGARLVISAPNISGETYKDEQVRFNYMGVPLATVCSLFFPYIIYGVREFFHNEFIHSGVKYPYTNADGSVQYVILKDPETHFSDEYFIKMIKKFIFGVDSRFETIDIPENEEGLKLKLNISGRFGKQNTNITRPMTWADILFIVCNKFVGDKHIYATRYPVDNVNSINPSKMSILTTKNTIPAIIGDEVYKFYPEILPDKDSTGKFIDTFICGNDYLVGYGGDYDGDMLSLIGAYTNEANDDAEKFTKSKLNIINLTNENTRVIQRDFVQTVYMFTRQPKEHESIPKFKNLSKVHNF